MICFRFIFFVFYLMFNMVLGMQIVQKNTNDAIGFPEIEENPRMVNKQNRQPVFIPSICPENQLLYPGDQTDDWICDCRPGHIYDPNTDKCYPAYQRGPCNDSQYLVLSTKSSIPLCVANPCKQDGLVLWKDKCKAFGTTCGEKFPVAVLWIDAVTINVDCVKLVDVESRFASVTDFKISCPMGSKRNIQNRCIPS